MIAKKSFEVISVATENVTNIYKSNLTENLGLLLEVKTNMSGVLGKTMDCTPDFQLPEKDCTPQHLHAISNEPITGDCWFTNGVKIFHNTVQLDGYIGFKKIVASTDKELDLPLIPEWYAPTYIHLHNTRTTAAPRPEIQLELTYYWENIDGQIAFDVDEARKIGGSLRNKPKVSDDGFVIVSKDSELSVLLLAKKYIQEGIINHEDGQDCFIAGYKANPNKFSDDDMRTAMDWAAVTGHFRTVDKCLINQYIEDLKEDKK